MPWVRIDEHAMEHPKVAGLPDGAFRLWVAGLAHCQKFLTDGFIAANSMRSLRAFSVKRSRDLIEAQLWTETEKGVLVHDYLDWNDARQTVLENRDWNKRRRELYADPGLLASIRARDKDCCRYCGKTVNWKDRRGPEGGTYDHVVPRGPNTLENIVVACRGCNASKGDKQLGECGMRMIPVSELDRYQIEPRPHIHEVGGVGGSSQTVQAFQKVSTVRQPRVLTPSEVSDEIAERAGRFCERYADLYAKHRKGARYLGKPTLDFQEALQLVATWDDQRLDKIATVFLTTDHEFAEKGSRTMAQFRAMASWCDSRLIEAGVA